MCSFASLTPPPSIARLEFIPMKIGTGMTILIEMTINKQTLTKYFVNDITTLNYF